jgi:GNAT superfamily N-acetyltransferase
MNPVSNQTTFRTATLDDLPTLLEFEQGIIEVERSFDPTLAPDPISYYDLGELVKSNDAEVMVALVGDELVGSGYAKKTKSKSYVLPAYYAYLGFMFVRADQRGKGINQGLTEALIGWAKSKGLSEIRLDVYAENASAIRAYEKSGFKKHMIEMRRGI